MMSKCLFCYKELIEGEIDFHPACSKKIFGYQIPPEIPFDLSQLKELALKQIHSHAAIPGVQPKLSLEIRSEKNENAKKFTIVGLIGGYILKPPTTDYPQLPEVEDLTMHLAEIAKIKVVPHSLVRMKSGQLAYLTKRIDREKNQKIHLEDMCQLTERLTENKYNGSYEQVAKAILKFSVNPGLDVIIFYEQVLFSFLTGNADMHLKNFSIIHHPIEGPMLSPAYDLVSTALVNPADDEELALTLNGKKKKIKRADFLSAFDKSIPDKKQQENIFKKMEYAKVGWLKFIDKSFISPDFKHAYKVLIDENFKKLFS